MKIAKGNRVRLKVELSVVGGKELEKNVVEYIHGGGTMLPGLERVLDGLGKGDKRDGVLKAAEAFGNPSMHPSKKMARNEFPKEAQLKVGEKFTAKGANDNLNVVLLIEKVGEDFVDVKLVHPLADKDIKYAVEVLAVIDTRPPPVPAEALELEEEPKE